MTWIAKTSKTTNDSRLPGRICNIPKGVSQMKAFGLLAVLTMSVLASPASAFEISSPAIGSDGKIPLKHTANAFGCTGESLALTVYDPDAPTGSGFWHWLVVNIPVSTTELPEGAGEPGNGKLPPGSVQARGDAGVAGYFGPCPPEGDSPHRYIFTIFAVKTDKLDVNADTSGAVVGFNLNFNTIEKASVTYTYGR
jgi:Raf kinase inhibitor-like YbhB/YbcL family protein